MPIEKITADAPEAKSADVQADNVAKLKALFPDLVTEGKDGVAVDVNVLKQLVGDRTVAETEEKYGLDWHGKRKARQLALTPSTGTLRPCPKESEAWDTTQNLMIEGDNLEVLKLLQKSYAGRVKMIYIDPPYNTGKDFVYPDDFRDNIKNYLELTGQVKSDKKMVANTEASGRFHTDWLNMLYPRLRLARRLLCEDGIIFISIDDNELSNLFKLCDEVFGEERFIATFKWNKTSKAPTLSGKIRNKYEFILCYSKGEIQGLQGPASYNTMAPLFNIGNGASTLKFPPHSIRCLFEDGTYEAGTYGSGEKAVTLESNLIVKGEWNSNAVVIKGRFKWAQATTDRRIAAGQRFAFKKPNFTTMYYYLQNEEDDGSEKRIAPSDIINMDECDVERNDEGYIESAELFGGVSVFDYCKPSSLIKYLCSMIPSDDFIVMDFFAGSGTTAHAVMQLNAQDNGRRRQISVQLPEVCADGSAAQRAGFKTIADITKERIRLGAKKIKVDSPLIEADLGFRVYKLDSSNIREWDPKREDMAATLDEHAEHLKTGRTEVDILTELLLKLGLDLCVPIESRTISGVTVYSIGAGTLFACLTEAITRAQVKPLGQGILAWRSELKVAVKSEFVFRDSAFADDVAKTNLAAYLEQNLAESQRGRIRSL